MVDLKKLIDHFVSLDLHSLDENDSETETGLVTSWKQVDDPKTELPRSRKHKRVDEEETELTTSKKHRKICSVDRYSAMEPFPFPCSSNAADVATSSNLKHNVFLSFRGEDTRYNFTNHLHAALIEKKIETFIDNDLIRGEEISPSLLKQIEASKISVVILSQNYASSKWCLEELVKIIECMRNNDQIVIPVFYHVDPSDVRHQRGNFNKAFSSHKNSPSVNEEQVNRWKCALEEVSGISGHHLTPQTPEAEVIKKITKDILKTFNKLTSSYLLEGLIGMEPRILEIESLLELDSSGVKCVGIWGMGGLGKTTLARVIYDKVSSQFEACCFLPNTREAPLANLQDKLFSALLDDRNLATSTCNFQLSSIKDRLCHKKVLIVVDDADNSTKLQELLVGRDPRFFGLGSRILVTSRDRQVLKYIAGDEMYNMKELNEEEATQLFSLKAFKKNSLPSGYKCPSTEILMEYAKGNPLALTVLGSRLFGKSEEDWRNVFNSLKQIPGNEIHDVLKTSYDALHPEMKRIFLDIACCYRGEKKELMVQVWNKYSIDTLVDLSLISVSDDFLELHDLLQEMAQRIVIEESKKPNKRSRHWNPDEICNMLEANEGTNAIEVISLDMSKAREIQIEPDTFSKMRRLRMLNIYWRWTWKLNDSHERNKLLFSALKSLPSELRYLCWEYFPKKTLASNFNPRNLVVLELRNGKVKKLWKGTQNLVSLRRIDLGNSKHLISIPDLSKATNIEDIILCGCENLEEVHPSIEHLINLKNLNLEYCRKLRMLPRRLNSKVLQILSLFDCPRIEWLPDFEWNGLQKLELDCSGIKDAESNSRLCSALSNNFCRMKSLEVFVLSNCSILESFPEIMEPMNNLKRFRLINCTRLKSLPDRIFYNLKSLMSLYLSGSAIKELPSSIIYLKNLLGLRLDDCKYLESLPTSINALHLLDLKLNSCESLRSLQELPPRLLQCAGPRLNLNIKELKKDNLVSLRKIDLQHSKHLISIPDLSKATNIEDIDLEEHPINLKILNLMNCPKLRTLPRSLSSKVRHLHLYNCPRIEGLPGFEWNGLQQFSLDFSGIKDAESNSRLYSALSNNFCGMKSLDNFELSNCSILEIFPEIMEPLKSFELLNCTRLESLPDRIFYNLKSLETLDLSGSAIKELPLSIIDLKNLDELKLNDCKYLESLPTSINTLSKLTTLSLNSCESLRSLQELPPNLKILQANHCKSLETIGELPPDFYLLETNHCESLETIGFGEFPTQLQCANCPRLNLNIKELNIKLESEHRCQFLYSGSEIPEWFIHQSWGSSITLQSPLYLEHFCSLVFCVVFEITKPLEDDDLKFIIRSNFSKFESKSCIFLDQKLLGTDLVLIWRGSIQYGYGRVNLSSLDFYCCSRWFSEEPCESCVVKSCGFYCGATSYAYL